MDAQVADILGEPDPHFCGEQVGQVLFGIIKNVGDLAQRHIRRGEIVVYVVDYHVELVFLAGDFGFGFLLHKGQSVHKHAFGQGVGVAGVDAADGVHLEVKHLLGHGKMAICAGDVHTLEQGQSAAAAKTDIKIAEIVVKLDLVALIPKDEKQIAAPEGNGFAVQFERARTLENQKHSMEKVRKGLGKPSHARLVDKMDELKLAWVGFWRDKIADVDHNCAPPQPKDSTDYVKKQDNKAKIHPNTDFFYLLYPRGMYNRRREAANS